MLFVALSVSALAGCAGSESRDEAKKIAECASTEAVFGTLASKVIDSGACDKQIDEYTECVAYRAVEEAFLQAMEKLDCPTSSP